MRKYKKFGKKYYNKINFKKDFSKTQSFFLMVFRRTRLFSSYYHEFLRILDQLPYKANILDVGCANGSFLNFIHRIRPDLELYGLDLTDVSEFLPKYVKFIQADATKFKLRKKFDLIICNHLLEHLHVEDVLPTLTNINLHLKDEGVFWFTVPSFCREFYNDPTHVRPYTKEAMKRLLKMSDFKRFRVYEGFIFNKLIRLFKKERLIISFGYAKK